jgi:hypothetical protein
VTREDVGLGIRAGVVAAAATLGALLAFGLARGAPFQPINAVAHTIIGARAFLTTGWSGPVTLTALVVHLMSLCVWGVLFALVSRRLCGWWLLFAAIAFSGVAYITDCYLAPERLRPGFESVLSRGELGVVYFTLALALATMMQLQRTPDATEEPAVTYAEWTA